MRFPLLFFAFYAQVAFAQSSTFDSSNDGWTADGDAENGAAVWQSTAGTPGGYILGTDGANGGAWYFVAPAKYHGIKCDAYGHFLRYDQYVSNAAAQQTQPDVELIGSGIKLVFNNPLLPGTSWTHFDLLIREDAGWRLNTLNGQIPTMAQFKKVLCNVTSLRIRGEYIFGADDNGGLDNFVLESNFYFEFDLDGDDNSGAISGAFQTPPTCNPNSHVVDNDLILNTIAGIDSIVVQVVGPTAVDELVLDILVGGITVHQSGPGMLTFVNDGTATAADFITLLHNLQYFDTSAEPVSGVRVIDIEVFTDCCVVENHRAYLPIVAQPDAGLQGDTVLCYGSEKIDLRTILQGSPDFNGRWEPPLFSAGNFFDPNVDSAGTYTYIVPEADPCSGDSVQVSVKIHYPFQLRADTTVCYDKTLFLEVPRGLVDWTWSDGSQKPQLPVVEPGTYTLVGATDYCTYSDSVAVDFITCIECPPYAPNVFSPNEDGTNDDWHIFLNCRWTDYRLEVYDRWGNLVFAADDPESTWDGRMRGKDAVGGVYVWRMRWTGELLGAPKSWAFEGDVTVLR
jgi:gliding motility-associated-like protein